MVRHESLQAIGATVPLLLWLVLGYLAAVLVVLAVSTWWTAHKDR